MGPYEGLYEGVHQVAISSLAAIAPLWCHCTAGPHMWGGPTHSWAMGTYGVPCMAIPLYTLGRPYIEAYVMAYMRGGGYFKWLYLA